MGNPQQTNQGGLPHFTCPICEHNVNVGQDDPPKLPKFFPFCSERCKLIDLGAWFDSEYRIPSRPDEASEAPTADEEPSR